MRRLTAWARDRKGGVATMAAAGAALACIIAAVVIDGGSIVLTARSAQAAADLGALSATRDLSNAQRAAAATVQANLGDTATAMTVTGVYEANPATPPADRFQPMTASFGASPIAAPNAAKVTVRTQARVWFARLLLGRDTLEVERTGVAATRRAEPLAALSIGSRLASLDGGLANQVLSGLTGSQVSLEVMDYRALADVKVDLLGFTDALSTHAGLRVGDYDSLMTQEVDAGDALTLLQTLTDGADSALNQLARAAHGKRFVVGDLIGVAADAPNSLRGGLAVGVSALDLTNAMLEIAGGDRQVALDLGARAGIADIDVWLAVGERPNRSPWLTVTRTGQPIIRTAQARLYLEVRTQQSLAGLAQVKLPLLIELASSEARLDRLNCDGARWVQVGVRPGVARARIGTTPIAALSDFRTAPVVQKATLVNVASLVTVRASADIEAADAGFRSTLFDAAAIAGQTPRTVKSTSFTSGVVSSLLGRMDVQVNVIGLGLGLGDLPRALAALLAPLGPVLDQVVNAVLDTLGLSLGEADVTVHGLTCPDPSGAAYLVG
jgi:uncharacterized membrane protein